MKYATIFLYQVGTENLAQERGTKMTQFFNHQEAESFRSDVMVRFPRLHVDKVLDIHDTETGKYERSFFNVSLWDDKDLLHSAYVNSEEGWNGILLFSRYIFNAIADNQQSEEVEQGRSFTDQNGLTVQQGGVYGVNEQGELYDIEPLNRIRPSEY